MLRYVMLGFCFVMVGIVTHKAKGLLSELVSFAHFQIIVVVIYSPFSADVVWNSVYLIQEYNPHVLTIALFKL